MRLNLQSFYRFVDKVSDSIQSGVSQLFGNRERIRVHTSRGKTKLKRQKLKSRRPGHRYRSRKVS